MIKQYFEKYQATGNDFIIIAKEQAQFDLNNPNIISKLCNRRFGIGADGLIIYQPHSIYDFEMFYHNADGLPASFCGNGARAIVEYAYSKNLIGNKGIFKAIDGNHFFAYAPGKISIQMHVQSQISRLEENIFEVNTGSPHYIEITTSPLPRTEEFLKKARAIRYNSSYRLKGINVNLVSLQATKIEMMTYERGVENLTLSCGTGVTAAALVAQKYYHFTSPIEVHTLGGVLYVQIETLLNEVWLIGPAVKVFQGEVFINRHSFL
ncbi:MAG: diaminopimelate epimerase [Bacteroidia bacterium]|nr:diaminopimelate epimerase [Bacteroidia bacterium]MDW8158092.1 diaminopimelate epimerase [Bacteroidia bacterium]